MMKKAQKCVNAIAAVFMFTSVFSLTGCGTTENTDLQTGIEEMSVDKEAGSVMRAYSDKEQERMKELQASYQNETAKPENMIQEVDSAGK